MTLTLKQTSSIKPLWTLLVCIATCVTCCSGLAIPNNSVKIPPHPNGTGHGHGVHVVSWNYEYVRGPLLTTLFIFAAGCLKLAFHKAHFLSSVIPESCLLIIVGIAFGGILEGLGESEAFNLDPRTFMLYLLPPIILDSAYSLVDRVFAENIGTILMYAVAGSISCCFMLGPTLYGLAMGGGMNLDISLVECLLFASFIIAVDPVAVLAIFQEIGVNDTLYFLVFGESLLNDAVTVVLSNMMKAFVEMDNIPPSQIGIGIASFFTISLGGLTIGIIFGILTALITRTTKDVRVIEPLAVLSLAYLSYIVAELFHWSGIISIIGCGIMQAQYAFHNISRKSSTTVIYFIKMTSSSCDCMIFLFLGVEVIRNPHEWNTGFVLWSTFYCLVFRFIIVFGLTFIVNLTRPHQKINFQDQFIMWYGGLRGAVCFALCDTLNPKFRHKNMFLTTTFFIIGFTVFIQGITIKPLVKLCRVRTKEDYDGTIIEEINERVMDHTMTGVEVIAQQKGAYFVRATLLEMNDKYFSRWLQNNPMTQDEKILQAYGNMIMSDYEHSVKQQYVNPIQAQLYSHFYKDVMRPISEIDDDKRLSQFTSHSGGSSIRKRQFSRSSRGSSRRKSISDMITGKHTFVDEDDPTAEDVAAILRFDSKSTSVIHRKYDPNLIHDDDRDLVKQIEERHRRIERMKRATIMRHSQTSDPSSPKDEDLNANVVGNPSPVVQRLFSKKSKPKAKPRQKPSVTQRISLSDQNAPCVSLEDLNVSIQQSHDRRQGTREHQESESSV